MTNFHFLDWENENLLQWVQEKRHKKRCRHYKGDFASEARRPKTRHRQIRRKWASFLSMDLRFWTHVQKVVKCPTGRKNTSTKQRSTYTFKFSRWKSNLLKQTCSASFVINLLQHYKLNYSVYFETEFLHLLLINIVTLNPISKICSFLGLHWVSLTDALQFWEYVTC